MSMINPLLIFFLHFFFFSLNKSQMLGFKSIDCGGNETYQDDLGLLWTPDTQIFGEVANISVSNENRQQFKRLRYFPPNNGKFCYKLDVTVRTRYLIRASFLYGNFDNNNVYPTFDISIGATHWSTIVIEDANTTVTEEVVFLASSPSVSICLSNGTTGRPFISTIELRQFNNSLYQSDFETHFFLRLSARINFGAESNQSVRYPDDPFDRIWESDSLRKQYLVNVAPGTEKISTNMTIDVQSGESPPEKVMQTAVVGGNEILNYQLLLNGFPGHGWEITYFAEIENFGANESRKFKPVILGDKERTDTIIDVQEGAQGKYRLYQSGTKNISLPSQFPLAFKQTNDSSRGPILNALEIYNYLGIHDGSLDAQIMENIVAENPHAVWAQEGGDPCLPVPWSWVKCNIDPQPRIVSINLSGKNLTGSIFSELTNLTDLVEIWLDGNQLTGSIPDLTACSNLRKLHLENNYLTGELPSWLVDLPNLTELYVQNNMLDGTIPCGLLRKLLVFKLEHKGSRLRIKSFNSCKWDELLLLKKYEKYEDDGWLVQKLGTKERKHLTSVNGESFKSIDCGGNETYQDDLGLLWTPDTQIFGEVANISVSNENRQQFKRLRYFPPNNGKFCYKLDVTVRTRYLIRANFLYGNFDNNNVYPTFDISIGATHWSTIVIEDANTTVTEEVVFLASSPSVSICLSNGTTGRPFISTIELRQFNNSLYQSDFETHFFLRLSARINFGADSNQSVRYPDDPFDRIWESDSLRKQYLVNVAPGTEKISTNMTIDVQSGESPPEKVMQTAVVGGNEILNYQLLLNGFPGHGWEITYFAEIENFGANESRKFKPVILGDKERTDTIIDVQEGAQGKYRLYQSGTKNISLPSQFPLAFKQTNDSSRGPILNALEIYNYLGIHDGSLDAQIMENIVAENPHAVWAQEGGDPCLPVPWSWVKCNIDPQPRIVSINLSGKNLTGSIFSELTNLTDLVEIWLDGNQLTGSIPDLTACSNLRKLHLENNYLTGDLPSWLVDLPNLTELYVQNNMLDGTIPCGLLRKLLVFNYSGNMNLRKKRTATRHTFLILCWAFGSLLLLGVFSVCVVCARKIAKLRTEKGDVSTAQPPQQPYHSSSGLVTETATQYTLDQLKDATEDFAKKVGLGGYGIVFYGKMEDGREIAVKVLKHDTNQGTQQFSNEVSLLSRIHHRNLVAFLGYCNQDGRNMLVYEFMHNGTLKEHIHGLSRGRHMNWMKRLEIAEDTAKGIEYLHTGCSPSIIHRDLKTSNILLDENMRAKVADFGLSKPIVEESHVSTIVRGTLGYLDPEYYSSQQLTAKSDVYSFGIILLELVSGQEPISLTSFGQNFRNIGQWARSLYEAGDVKAITDRLLEGAYSDDRSLSKIIEVALRCIEHDMKNRPCMSDVLREIQEAIAMEQAASTNLDASNISALECTSIYSLTQRELR